MNARGIQTSLTNPFTDEEALSDVKSAIACYVEVFGKEMLANDFDKVVKNSDRHTIFSADKNSDRQFST